MLIEEFIKRGKAQQRGLIKEMSELAPNSGALMGNLGVVLLVLQGQEDLAHALSADLDEMSSKIRSTIL